MSIGDIIVVGVLSIGVVCAVVASRRHKGGCCGGCTGCANSAECNHDKP